MFIEVHAAVGEEVEASVAEPGGDLLDRIAARAQAEGIRADEWSFSSEAMGDRLRAASPAR